MTMFSAFQVRDILRIDYTRLQEWIRREYIIPTVPAKGRGTKAQFSLEDLYAIQTFKVLLERGIDREHASVMVKNTLMGKRVFWNVDIFTYREKVLSFDIDNGTFETNLSGGLGIELDAENELYRITVNLAMIKEIVDSFILMTD